MGKRKRNLELAKFYHNKPCVVCGSKANTCGDHIKSFGSGGECSFENMWALCPEHHLEKHNSGLLTFVNKYPQLEGRLKLKGWKFEEFAQKWIRLTDEGWED